MTDPTYYLSIQGVTHGPYSSSDISSWIEANTLDPGTLAWDGVEWRNVADIVCGPKTIQPAILSISAIPAKTDRKTANDAEMTSQYQTPPLWVRRLRGIALVSTVICSYGVAITTGILPSPLAPENIGTIEGSSALKIERAAMALLVAHVNAIREGDSASLLKLVTGPRKQEVLAAGTMGINLSKRFLWTMGVEKFLQTDSYTAVIRVFARDPQKFRDPVVSRQIVHGSVKMVVENSEWKLSKLTWDDEQFNEQPSYAGLRPLGAKTAAEFVKLVSGKTRSEIEALIGPGEIKTVKLGTGDLDRSEYTRKSGLTDTQLALIESEIVASTYIYAVPLIFPYGRTRYAEIRYKSDGRIDAIGWSDIPESRLSVWPNEITGFESMGAVADSMKISEMANPKADRTPPVAIGPQQPEPPGVSRISHPLGGTITWGPMPGVVKYGVRRQARLCKNGSRTAGYFVTEYTDTHRTLYDAHVEAGWYSVIAFDTQNRELPISYTISVPPPVRAPELPSMNYVLCYDAPVKIVGNSFASPYHRVGRRAFSDIALIRFSASGDTKVLAAGQYPWDGPVDTPPIFYGRLEGWPDTSFVACRAEDLEGNEFFSDSHVLLPDPLFYSTPMAAGLSSMDSEMALTIISAQPTRAAAEKPRWEIFFRQGNPWFFINGIFSIVVFICTFYKPRLTKKVEHP